METKVGSFPWTPCPKTEESLSNDVGLPTLSLRRTGNRPVIAMTARMAVWMTPLCIAEHNRIRQEFHIKIKEHICHMHYQSTSRARKNSVARVSSVAQAGLHRLGGVDGNPDDNCSIVGAKTLFHLLRPLYWEAISGLCEFTKDLTINIDDLL